MTGEEKAGTAAMHDRMLREALAEECDLLILDELCAARQTGLLDEALAKRAVLDRPTGREIVITGRLPEAWMLEAADYVTEMRCHRHPYEKGIAARKGIEF